MSSCNFLIGQHKIFPNFFSDVCFAHAHLHTVSFVSANADYKTIVCNVNHFTIYLLLEKVDWDKEKVNKSVKI